MPTKKQTSETESTAAPKKTAAPKASAAKKPAAEQTATPTPAENGAQTKKAPAKKPAAEKTEKPAAPKTAAAGKTAASTASAGESTGVTKLFGEIEASGNTFFIRNGSIPEGQLQLVLDKGKKDLSSRLPGYAGQFVTVRGEYGKQKKTDKFPTFMVHNLVSHNEIGHRAFELSHDNPTTVEDNWFRAENELLGR